MDFGSSPTSETHADRRDLVDLIRDIREREPEHILYIAPQGDTLAWTLILPDSAPELLRQRLAYHREALTRLLADVLTERSHAGGSDTPLWERMHVRAALARDMAEDPTIAPARRLLTESHGPQQGDAMLAAVLLALRAGQACG